MSKWELDINGNKVYPPHHDDCEYIKAGPNPNDYEWKCVSYCKMSQQKRDKFRFLND